MPLLAPPPLRTIGYEGATIAQVLDRLTNAGVTLLVDVRAVAQSRKPGFSKRQLAAALDERNIGYLHLRDLGTPKSGRIAARAGRHAEMLDIFATHMRGEPAQHQLAEATTIAQRRPLCLLCFEADPAHCHRTAVARLICTATEQPVEHLVTSGMD